MSEKVPGTNINRDRSKEGFFNNLVFSCKLAVTVKFNILMLS